MSQLCIFNVYNFSQNLHDFVNWSTHFQTMDTILYIQSTHFSKDVYNSLHSTYTFFKPYTQFCAFNLYNFSKNIPNYVNTMFTFLQEYIELYTFYEMEYVEYTYFSIFNV